MRHTSALVSSLSLNAACRVISLRDEELELLCCRTFNKKKQHPDAIHYCYQEVYLFEDCGWDKRECYKMV